MSRIRDTSKTLPLIVDKSKAMPRVDPAQVTAALGAEPTPFARLETAVAPLTIAAIREELYRRLQSTGGRPALEGADRRAKIPLGAEQWELLERIAAEVATEGYTPSAGQVASVVLSMALRDITARPSGEPEAAGKS